jgi:molecular chaperone GrpE
MMKKSKEHMSQDQRTENLVEETKDQAMAGSGDAGEAPELQDAGSAESGVVAKLEAEVAAAKDKYLRLLSEFENFKKRNARERENLVKMAGSGILLSVLPVMDDFERAVKSMEDTEAGADRLEGVRLILNKLKATLEAKGVKPMDAVGKAFDADLHDAISSIPAPSDELKGKVLEEIEKGYYLHDNVLRHAKVIVAA